jgi:hypothetical protein
LCFLIVRGQGSILFCHHPALLTSYLDFQDVLVIDSFSSETELVVTVLPDPIPPQGVSNETVTLDDTVLGGEREFYIYGNGQIPGLTFTGIVSNGSANLETPVNGHGALVCNYDGIGFTPAGLDGYDLTQNGASGFRVSVKCDHNVYVAVNLHNSLASISVQKLFTATPTFKSILFHFSEFKTNLTSVNSVEFSVEVANEHETLIAYVDEFTTVIMSTTVTPTPSSAGNHPSHSSTPTRSPSRNGNPVSHSSTPTRPPPPSGKASVSQTRTIIRNTASRTPEVPLYESDASIIVPISIFLVGVLLLI